MGIFFSFVKKVYKFGPIILFLCIVLSFFSNVMQILAFFLPLKALVLIGRGNESDVFFPGDAQYLHFLLPLSAVLAYALHFLFARLFVKYSAHASKAMARRATKFLIVNQWEDRAAELHAKVSNVIANILFVLAVLIVGFFFAFEYTISFILLAVTGWTLVYFIFFYGKDSYSFQYAKFVQIVSNVLFFVYFFIILVLLKLRGDIFFALASLICSRVILTSIQSSFKDVHSVSANSSLLRSIFYSNSFEPLESPAKGIWENIKNKSILVYLKDYLKCEMEAFKSVEYHQTGYKNSIVIAVNIQQAAHIDELVLKYTEDVSSQKRELDLLLERWANQLPFLLYMDVLGLASGQAILYKGGIERIERDVELIAMKNFILSCWGVRIDPDFLEKYYRTYGVPKRGISHTLIERLESVAIKQEHKNLLGFLTRNFQNISSMISQLPLTIVNPELYYTNLYLSNKRLVAMNWSRWFIDCAGAAVPVSVINEITQEDMAMLETHRKDFSSTSKELLLLSSLVSKINEHAKYDSFEFIFDLLNDIKNLKLSFH